MDDRQQPSRYFLYCSRSYRLGKTEDWQRRYDAIYPARREDFQNDLKQRFEKIKDELRQVETILREVLKAQLLLLNQFDHQLAELTGQPPPKQVPRRSFIGKRSLLGPCHEAFCEERRRTRQVLNRNGIWRSSIFPTLEEAETYDRQQAQKKAQKRAERKAKQMVRMRRWLDERLGVEKIR